MAATTLDYQALSREFIRALRGPRNQRHLSSQLGYRFNQVGKWEKGFKQIKWSDFLKIARALEIPVERHFRDYFWNFNGEFDEWTSLSTLEECLHLYLTQMKVSRTQKRKWKAHKGAPSLAEVFAMMDQRPWLLDGWLALFTDCDQLKSIRDRYQIYLARLEAVFNDPISVYLNAALHTEAYRELTQHDETVLAHHATCSVAQIRKSLKNLVAAGIITFDGQKYQPCPWDFSFASQPHVKLRILTKYSTDLAASRYSLLPAKSQNAKPFNASRSSVRVTAMSSEAASKVSELITRFHSEVAEIVAQDHGAKQNVQVILVHSFASTVNAPRVEEQEPRGPTNA